MKDWLRRNWFVVGIVLMVLIGALAPAAGAHGGLLQTEWTTRAAVFLVFVVQGLCLPTEDLARGFSRWRFHVGVQAYIFVVNAAFAFAAMRLLGEVFPQSIRYGYLLLGALPTTVSTALVYAVRAGARPAETLFNLTAANLLAVFLAPAWMVWVTRGETEAIDPLPVFLKIFALIVVPLIIGQCARPFFRKLIGRFRSALGNFNSCLILFIVYASISQSVSSGLWRSHGWLILVDVLLLCAGLLALNWALLLLLRGLLGIARADFMCVFFLGSFKSLAAGVPMAGSLFSAQPEMLGGVVLPILVYAVLQLSIGGLWADYWARRS